MTPGWGYREWFLTQSGVAESHVSGGRISGFKRFDADDRWTDFGAKKNVGFLTDGDMNISQCCGDGTDLIAAPFPFR
jgi:hypothetical protein